MFIQDDFYMTHLDFLGLVLVSVPLSMTVKE